MASKDLSNYTSHEVPSGKSFRIAVIHATWNAPITDALLDACVETLTLHEVPEEQINVIHVPGSFELPSASQMLLESS